MKNFIFSAMSSVIFIKDMVQLFFQKMLSCHKSDYAFLFSKERLEISTYINLNFIAATRFWSSANFTSAVPNTLLFLPTLMELWHQVVLLPLFLQC